MAILEKNNNVPNNEGTRKRAYSSRDSHKTNNERKMRTLNNDGRTPDLRDEVDKSIRKKAQRSSNKSISNTSTKAVRTKHEAPKTKSTQKRVLRKGTTYVKPRGKFNKNLNNKSPLKIIPLGGLDAIGKNMTVFEYENDIILVDAGLMFPDDEHMGVDIVLPDFTYILDNAEKLRGIFITHGHEDHIGAIPYLLQSLNLKGIKIYGSKLSNAIIESKLEEFHIKKSPTFLEVQSSTQVSCGQFEVEFFSVNHSIPGAMGVFIQTPAGNVLHTGDFKLDQTPIDGVRTDFQAISRFSEIGVDLLISDSTNANKSEFTKSEAEVGVALRHIIKNAPRKVAVASFSSHIHRIQQVIDAAAIAHRKVVVSGRSMLTNIRIAKELGYLDVDDDMIIDAFECNEIPASQIVILCTGSQGEPLSALARLSIGEHKTLEIGEGDTVIFSATPVPGNEKSVSRVINHLSKIGVDVYDKDRALVHVSGHAGCEELKFMLSLVAPTNFMPVHGEAMHLRAHGLLAQQVGIPLKNIFIIDNGDTLEMRNGNVSFGKKVESGIVYVEGSSVGDIGANVLHDRNRLSTDGILTYCVNYNRSYNLVGQPRVMMRGVPGYDNSEFIKKLQNLTDDLAKQCIKEYRGDNNKIANFISDGLKKAIFSKYHRRPLIIPFVQKV